jgi:hypothetical protein
MGLPGIRQLMKAVTYENIVFTQRFAGKKVAVDGMYWVHKLCARHARSLHAGDFTSIVEDFLNQAQWVERRGVELIFVFDGAAMPGKHDTTEAREIRRAKALAEIEALESAGIPVQHMKPQLFSYAGWFPLIVWPVTERVCVVLPRATQGYDESLTPAAYTQGYDESLTPAAYFPFVNERHKGPVTRQAAALQKGSRVGTRECSPTHHPFGMSCSIFFSMCCVVVWCERVPQWHRD